jgi:5-methylcytosine-specific restriction endonuclease McrA
VHERYCQKHQRAERERHHAQRQRQKAAGGEQFEPREVFDRDGWRCGICGTAVNQALRYPHPMSASLDHVVPLALGGKHARANTRLAHLSCNLRKGGRTA